MQNIDETRIAHMGMSQGIITRLETNAFTLKALAMTLATAVLAIGGSVENPTWLYPLAGVFPVVVFWLMDAKYLQLGRLFRRHFDAVRQGQVESPFDMNITPYRQQEQHLLRIALSWSVLPVYGSILAIFVGAMVFLLSCNLP